MKSGFITFITSLFLLSSPRQHSPIEWRGSAISHQLRIEQTVDDSSQSIHVINTSSLKRIPAVIADLSAALNEPVYKNAFLLDKKGLTIYLYDVICSSVKISAAVQYNIKDTIYHLKLNRFNQQASDKALAVTLIHEIMHCVLLEINKRARQGDKAALAGIENFGLSKNDPDSIFDNDFFTLMNRGEEGQHELMYRLFYPRMVQLLERFGAIHKETALDHKQAKVLMWSGLQRTTAFKKFSFDERQNIELAILAAKGIPVEGE